jgi:transcriptional regulator with XRE-family HTH domain
MNNIHSYVQTNLMASDLIAKTEARRRLMRLSQQELARDLGITQGHYSKLVRGHVPLASKAEVRLSAWLERSKLPDRESQERERLAGLIADHANKLNAAVKALLNEIR